MSTAATGNGIVFDGVHKSFGEVRALATTGLAIEPGEFVTLLGPSGSGKTTLLNIAAGYLAPDGGRILLGGRDITSLPPRQRNIGMVFQSYALFPHLDVFENVAYGLRARRRPAGEIARRVASALAMVKLDGFDRRAIHQLSGGQQQRVALARAMVIEPDLLLMDEPLGALDRQLRKHVQLEIRRLHLASRRTTLYVTHDQEEALVMSDRIAVMSEGRIEQVGTPAELYRAPKNVFVATFLGESNLLLASITSRSAAEVEFTVAGSAERWRIAAHAGLPAAGDGVLLVRPEDFMLVGAAEAGLDGRVAEIVYLGELTAMRLTLAAGQDVWLRQMKLPAVKVGDRARVRWDPRSVRLLATAGGKNQPGGSKP
jgi:ABC-type Fe3+/spermidine/putrescine transport system ATPase subunit